MKRVIGVTAMAFCSAVVVMGCGTTHAASGARVASGPSPSASPPAPAPAPRERADADAASILRSFVPPPGAVRLTAAPGGAPHDGSLRDGALPGVPGMPAGVADLVTHTSWWRVPGSPQKALAWEQSHLPGNFTMAGHGSSGSPPVVWEEDFTLPPVAHVLTDRGLAVSAVDEGGGRAALRIDASVRWLPAKPASERVPSAARMVTISATPGPMVGAKVPSPVTITDAAKVRKIASLVDGLTRFPPGQFSCPAQLTRSVRLTFRASADGPALAVATAGFGGCGIVSFSVGGKPQPALSGSGALARQVLAIAGLHWTGYGGGPLHPGGGVTPGGVMQPG